MTAATDTTPAAPRRRKYIWIAAVAIAALGVAAVYGIAGFGRNGVDAACRPALVNLHTTATANGMGNLATAFQNKTPLIVTAGQQTREMLLMEPWLTNVESTMLPRPWVK